MGTYWSTRNLQAQIQARSFISQTTEFGVLPPRLTSVYTSPSIHAPPTFQRTRRRTGSYPHPGKEPVHSHHMRPTGAGPGTQTVPSAVCFSAGETGRVSAITAEHYTAGDDDETVTPAFSVGMTAQPRWAKSRTGALYAFLVSAPVIVASSSR